MAKIRFNADKREEINNRKIELLKENGYGHADKPGIGIRVVDDSIYMNNWQVCKIDELVQTLFELGLIKQAIEEKTGMIL